LKAINKKNTAFSLLELAVVVTILGILLAIILSGRHVVSTSRLVNAKSQTINSPVKNISGLVSWYETSLPESFNKNEKYDGAQITKWYDINPYSFNEKKNTLSKNANEAVKYKAKGINDLPTLEFTDNGVVSDITLDLPSFFQGSLYGNTIFLVLQPSIIETSNVPINSYNDSPRHLINIRSINLLRMNAGVASDSNTVNISTNTPYILAAYFNSTSSKFYLNDASNIAGGGGYINCGTNSLNGLSIGAVSQLDTTSNFNGYISEIIIFNRPLKKTERIDIMSYLSKKYGIWVENLKDY